MPLAISTWQVNSNGTIGTLQITRADPDGAVAGSMFNNPIAGWWDEASQKLSFVRTINPNDPETFQIYTGHLYKFQVESNPQLLQRISGHFEAFRGTGGGAARSRFGWYAVK